MSMLSSLTEKLMNQRSGDMHLVTIIMPVEKNALNRLCVESDSMWRDRMVLLKSMHQLLKAWNQVRSALLSCSLFLKCIMVMFKMCLFPGEWLYLILKIKNTGKVITLHDTRLTRTKKEDSSLFAPINKLLGRSE